MENIAFLYDIAFGLQPRKFFYNGDDVYDPQNLILDEETEVSEMYFIMDGGKVGIGFYLMT